MLYRAAAGVDAGDGVVAGSDAGMRATRAIIRSLNCPSATLMVAASVAGQDPLEGTWISSFTGTGFAGAAFACGAFADRAPSGRDGFTVQPARKLTLQVLSP